MPFVPRVDGDKLKVFDAGVKKMNPHAKKEAAIAEKAKRVRLVVLGRLACASQFTLTTLWTACTG